MFFQFGRPLSLAVAAAFVAACSGDPGVAVIDLAATAKATGHDRLMQQQAETARADLASQVTLVAGNLGKQLEEEQARLGGPAAAARAQEFQQLAARARQQLVETQALAEQKAQAFEAGLAARYRAAILPVATQLARDRGAVALLVSDATLLWADESVDITDEVIAELRARPVDLGDPPPAADARGGEPDERATD